MRLMKSMEGCGLGRRFVKGNGREWVVGGNWRFMRAYNPSVGWNNWGNCVVGWMSS